MIVYSANGEDFNDTEVNDVIQTLVSHMDEDEWFIGAKHSYYKAEAIKHKPSDFINSDDILEQMQDRASDEGGEYADGFTYCSQEAEEELDKFISYWADKYLTCHFYQVTNSEEVFFTVDEEMYNDYN